MNTRRPAHAAGTSWSKWEDPLVYGRTEAAPLHRLDCDADLRRNGCVCMADERMAAQDDPFYCVACAIKLPKEDQFCRACWQRIECDPSCTSGCHADDCEHHGYPPAAEAAQPAPPLDVEQLARLYSAAMAALVKGEQE